MPAPIPSLRHSLRLAPRLGQLVLAWMWHDAKARGRNIRPWIVLTLPAGTIGPLRYLLTRKPA